LGDTLILIDNSTDADGPADIANSKWYVKNQGADDSTFVLKLSQSGYPAPPFDYVVTNDGFGVGNYTARLEVTDLEGNTSNAYKDFSITSSGNPPGCPGPSCPCPGPTCPSECPGPTCPPGCPGPAPACAPVSVNADIYCSPASCTVFSGDMLTLYSDHSTPSANIGLTEWITPPSSSYVSCTSPLCSQTVQTSTLIAGNYNVFLRVSDLSGTNHSTTTRAFTIKDSAVGDFACKIDAGDWRPCSSITQLSAGQTITFRDDSSTSVTAGSHYSISSTGGSLGARTWKIKGISRLQTSGQALADPLFTTLNYTAASAEVGNFSIEMTVTDTNPLYPSGSRTITKTYDLRLIPPPIWIEI
jgi:hypothetical protein